MKTFRLYLVAILAAVSMALIGTAASGQPTPVTGVTTGIEHVAPGYLDDSTPPVKYQGNVSAIVSFGTVGKCGVAPPGYVFLGCTINGVIVHLPNPCSLPAHVLPDSFSHLVCHEMGHVNGWPANHPRS